MTRRTQNLTSTSSRKFIYADGLASMEEVQDRANGFDAREESEKHAARMEKLNSKLDLALTKTRKFVSIVRSQLAKGHFAFVTYNQVDRRIASGDSRGREFVAEFISQERRDGVPEIITDQQILSFWKQGLSIGKALSVDPKTLAKRLAFPEVEGKPYCSPLQMLRVMATEEVSVTSMYEYIQSYLDSMVVALFGEEQVKQVAIETGDAYNLFEKVEPGFIKAYANVDFYEEEDGDDW